MIGGVLLPCYLTLKTMRRFAALIVRVALKIPHLPGDAALEEPLLPSVEFSDLFEGELEPAWSELEITGFRTRRCIPRS